VTILGLETATAVCSAAVIEDGSVRAEATVEERHVHAEKLLPQIEQVLKESSTGLEEISGIAVSIGPGSFTGLRIGLSVAKGLGYARRTPLVAVPTLQALAQRLPEAGGSGPTESILAALDARRDEVYAQLFEVREGRAVPVWDVRAVTAEEAVRDTAGADVVITGDAREKLDAKLLLLPPADRRRFRFAPKELSRCSAVSVARLGLELLRQGRTEDPGVLEPRYIKEFFFKSR